MNDSGIYPREMKAHVHIKSSKLVVMAGLFVTAPNWKKPNTHEQ